MHGAARPLGVVRPRLARRSSVVLLGWSLRRAGRLTFSRNLAASALFLVARLRPAAADRVRLGLCRHAARALSVRDRADRDPLPGAAALALRARASAIAGLAFVAASAPAARRLSMWLYDRAYDRELAALDHVPHGARMVSFVGRPCTEPWAMSRLLHLPAHRDRPPPRFLQRPVDDGRRAAAPGPLPARAGPSSATPTQIVTARALPRRDAGGRSTWRSPTSRATPSTMSG